LLVTDQHDGAAAAATSTLKYFILGVGGLKKNANSTTRLVPCAERGQCVPRAHYLADGVGDEELVGVKVRGLGDLLIDVVQGCLEGDDRDTAAARLRLQQGGTTACRGSGVGRGWWSRVARPPAGAVKLGGDGGGDVVAKWSPINHVIRASPTAP
jgi:hypothetical protein